ncbi:uncharacterized protein LOC113554637 [Rhopalosiphum maidis]|uniref:uncharacterized protein LOC113554637 n=1 Tax=Rhopalosiphum maidis TaxID=43146 RepID=UPI000EFDF73F|nr:uncharacterized protein LOC113554637 [Rhopalosiphum maidis]
MLDGYLVVTISAGLYFSIFEGIVCGNHEVMTVSGPTPLKSRRIAGNFSGDSTRSRRFVVVNGDGVPDYDGADDDDDNVVYDYDDGSGDHDHGYDHDYHDFEHDDDDYDDDDFNGPGYHHHVWWHHYYHHGEPHLPFPLFPPIFVYRRPVHRRCDHWPFVCRSTYEMIQWLQCYHEFLAGSEVHDGDGLHGLVKVTTHAWRK